MTEHADQIGRAKTVLVFGQGTAAKAVVTTITARVSGSSTGDRLRVVGPGGIAAATITHLREIVLSVADQIMTALGVSQYAVEISVANVGASSSRDLGLVVEGFSADVLILIVILSACLQVAARQTVVVTGHLASSDGSIAVVSDIPAKLAAAAAASATTVFLYPDPDSDASLRTLSPNRSAEIQAALARCPDHLRAIPVRDVADVIERVFGDEAIVLGSLSRGFFNTVTPPADSATPIARAAQRLGGNLSDRFWTVLERTLLDGSGRRAKRLLSVWSDFHTQRRLYPREFGRQLLVLLRSLPPATRRLKRLSGLLSIATCVKLSQFATTSDMEDVRLLFQAAGGDAARSNIRPEPADAPRCAQSDPSDVALDAVLSEIGANALARRIGVPIDTARASFSLPDVTVDSYDEFLAAISSYQCHLLRHIHAVGATVDNNAVAIEAVDLLDRTFAREGGLKAAYAEASDGTRGGLHFVLNAMTERFKAEEKTKYVHLVLCNAVDPLDWNQKVAFMGALLKRLAQNLPDDVRSEPPERYANHVEPLVQAYVRSTDEFNRLVRAL